MLMTDGYMLISYNKHQCLKFKTKHLLKSSDYCRICLFISKLHKKHLLPKYPTCFFG
jgi:hypothetical protein